MKGVDMTVDQRLAKLEDEMASVLNAMRSGNVCAYLGHAYQMPDLVVRSRIEHGAGWKLARTCERCGETDEHWEPRHWTIPEAGMTLEAIHA